MKLNKYFIVVKDLNGPLLLFCRYKPITMLASVMNKDKDGLFVLIQKKMQWSLQNRYMLDCQIKKISVLNWNSRKLDRLSYDHY